MPPMADAVAILAYAIALCVGLAILALFLGFLTAMLRAVLGLLYYVTRRPPQGQYVRVPLAAEVRAKVMARDGFACVYCGDTVDLTVDHRVSRAHGGGNEMSNLQTLCRDCNSRKGTHDD